MQSHPGETFHVLKKEGDDCTGSRYTGHLNSSLQEPIEVSSSSNEGNSDDTWDINDQSIEDSSKQLVLYDPLANDAGEIEPVPQPILSHHPFRKYSDLNVPSRVLPSVGAFTVQCAKCFKWRLIPTKQKYEELREHILEEPFFCETAREWRPDISCDDPTDIDQDGSRLWAIDKPNIAQPPPGWQRLLRIRGEGSTKFADVYYQAPSGKRLRSMVEIQKYLIEHPEYMRDGLTLAQFSFQIPKPLQENYVRKKRPRLSASCDDARPLEPGEANPLTWVGPGDCTELQLGPPAILPPPLIQSSAYLPLDWPVKKKARTPSKQSHRTNLMCNLDEPKVEEPDQSRNSDCDL
nr:methyl-CpG-binding domain-containing protein 2-like isoform X1 [Populus alba]XP_034906239.1 methyl-CpG-binding domain-containing protein 2-like isoform X1 [Populus alba]XP_034906240.1 methyl-CpG-binding domain-containing protein 2-like isoform X1 [Populus alba]